MATAWAICSTNWSTLLPAYPDDDSEENETIGIAIVGRPNVGKSSLLNALVGQERSIVSDVPGTTRDPIDMQLTYDGQPITLIDTAGIRRRGSVEQGIEQYSVLRSMRPSTVPTWPCCSSMPTMA